jgi:hypothetical protein
MSIDGNRHSFFHDRKTIHQQASNQESFEKGNPKDSVVGKF